MNKNSLIEKIKRGELFGVVDCSLQVPEEMYPYFEDFLQFSRIVKLDEMILGTI